MSFWIPKQLQTGRCPATRLKKLTEKKKEAYSAARSILHLFHLLNLWIPVVVFSKQYAFFFQKLPMAFKTKNFFMGRLYAQNELGGGGQKLKNSVLNNQPQ